MKQAIISGIGSYLPSKVLSNYDLEKQIETTHEWINTRTGINNRRLASKDEYVTDMGFKASLAALEDAKMDANSIDMIIVATSTPSHVFPSSAVEIQHLLHINRTIPCFDVSAACSGFIYILDIAYQYIRAGAAQNILIIGSEKMSSAVDWEDRSTCILFGDGAGAVILSAAEKSGVIATKIHSRFDHDYFLTYKNTSP